MDRSLRSVLQRWRYCTTDVPTARPMCWPLRAGMNYEHGASQQTKNEAGDFAKFIDTSSVTNMVGVFYRCKNLTLENIIMDGCSAETKKKIDDAFNKRWWRLSGHLAVFHVWVFDNRQSRIEHHWEAERRLRFSCVVSACLLVYIGMACAPFPSILQRRSPHLGHTTSSSHLDFAVAWQHFFPVL